MAATLNDDVDNLSSARETKLQELLANVAASCTNAGVRFLPEIEAELASALQGATAGLPGTRGHGNGSNGSSSSAVLGGGSLRGATQPPPPDSPPPPPSPFLPAPLPPLPPPGGYPPGHPHRFPVPPPASAAASHDSRHKGNAGPSTAMPRSNPTTTGGGGYGDVGLTGHGWWGEEDEVDEWGDDDDPGYVVLPLSDDEFLRFVEFAAEEQHQKQVEEEALAAEEEAAQPPPPPPPPPPPRSEGAHSPLSGSDDDDDEASDDGESDDGRHSERRRTESGQRLRTPAVGRPPRDDTHEKPSGAGTPPLFSTPSMSHDDEDRGAVTSAAAGGGAGEDGEEAFEDASGFDSDGERVGSDKTYATITHAPPPPPPPPPPPTLPSADGSTTEPAIRGATAAAAVTPQGAGAPHPGNAAAATASSGRSSGYEVSLGSFGLRVVFQHNRTGFEESKEFVAPRGTLIAGRYRVEETLGHAAFSTALQCVDLANSSLTNNGQNSSNGGSEPLSVCLKVIKNNKDFFDQSLDEIKLLHYLNSSGDPDAHHVLHMYDFFYYKEHLFLVSELLRENLYEFGKFVRESGDAPYFTLSNLKKIGRSILEALDFVHNLGLIHCDVKPENIVIRSYSRCEVKLIDFGSSCFSTDHPTTYIQSRSYRAPEVILGLDYDGRIDVWSLGCVIAEQLTGYVLFQNDSVQTMLARIQGILGPFPEKSLAAARDTAKYMTPNNIVYERVRVEPDEDEDTAAAAAGEGGASGSNGGASLSPEEAVAAAEQAAREVEAVPLAELVDLAALAESFEDLDDEDEPAREQRWQELVAAAADERRQALFAEKTAGLTDPAAAAANKAGSGAASEQYQYLVVYPKHTTLRHRLKTGNRLFLDFVSYLLTIDHNERPTAREALQHPWLFTTDDDDAEEERAWQARQRQWAEQEAAEWAAAEEHGH